VARLFWLESNQSAAENRAGFSLCYVAVLFSSHFLLLMRRESNYNLRVLCLQQGEIYFAVFCIYLISACVKSCVWWNKVEHSSVI